MAVVFFGCDARLRQRAVAQPGQGAKYRVVVNDKILSDLKSELSAVQNEKRTLLIPDRLDKFLKGSNAIGWGVTAFEYRKLEKREQELIGQIEIEKRTNTNAKKKLEQLEHEQKQHQQTAEEYSRRYTACMEKNKKPGK